jgi:hypothetical protein
MPSKIEISVLWFDDDIVELLVAASNENFSGQVSLYENHNAMVQLAETLSGFPACATDTRKFELGTFRPDAAGGGAIFELYCTDSVGHSEAKMQLRGDESHRDRGRETAQFFVRLEASAVDSFVRQLKVMELQRDSRAFLSAV